MQQQFLAASVLVVAGLLAGDTATASPYDHDKYVVSGLITHTYLGCEEGERIPEVFTAFGEALPNRRKRPSRYRGAR